MGKADTEGSGARAGVKVTCGIHKIKAALEGRSVAAVRAALSEPLDIDPGATALLNGSGVDEGRVLAVGDHLEFVQIPRGKGSRAAKERSS